jgi:hypothetical protein
VALNLLNPALLATDWQERFQREARFLAELRHPGISCLLDAGLTEEGTPYLVTELIEESPELESALTLLLDRTDGGDGEVTWPDVRDELTSGQWGRLIETGVLVDGDEGFRFAEPDAVVVRHSVHTSPYFYLMLLSFLYFFIFFFLFFIYFPH